MQQAGLQACLFTHLPDVRWLCGFSGSNAALALVATKSGMRAALFTDGRYTAQAREEAAGTRVIIPKKKSALVAACQWLAESGAVKCGVDAAHTTLAELKWMKKAVASGRRRILFKPIASLVARQREIKDADEILKMREAALTGCLLFELIREHIRPGATEIEVAAELEHAARMAGAEAMSFETIVAGGVRSSLPHGRATMARLPRKGFVTLDFGVMLNGYCSDMTRTVHLGRATRAERDAYDSVLEAQQAAVAAVAPGVTCGEVDAAARSVLKKAGLAKWFTHSTGHGVGIEIHEGPRIAAKQKQKLQAGMVITIEPGIYIPGRFGIRIEDMVLVTKTGNEILTPSPKTWMEL